VSSVVLTVYLLTCCREARTESLGPCHSLVPALVGGLPRALVRVEGPLPPLVGRGVRTTVGILVVAGGFALLLRGS
jgi:hypothetical protein